MKPEWALRVREARRRLKVSQERLAAIAGVSVDTIRAWETGRRHPSREHLTTVIDALRIERGEASHIFVGAGYTPDGLDRFTSPETEITRETAPLEVERTPWPAFISDEMGECIAANTLMQRVWGVDLATEFNGPVERNLLSVASNPRFAERCTNWDEAVGVLVGAFKGHHRGGEEIDAPSPYLSAVLEHFMRGDPQYVARFLDLWKDIEPAIPRRRWTYRIDWRIDGVGAMRFLGVSTTANQYENLAFQDWVPLDAETWLSLDCLR